LHGIPVIASIVSLENLNSLLCEATAIARRYFQEDSTAASVRYKDNATPVTSADTDISSLLRERLMSAVPGAKWLCEEDQDDGRVSSGALAWIVDPLDGTKEFVRRIPEVGISIALVAAGEPLLAGVTNPITGETGLWSRKEGLKVTAAGRSAVRLGESSANASRTEHEKGSLRPFEKGLREIRPLGSVAYKLLRLAEGREDLYFSVEPKSEWDICGGVALIRAMGLEYRRFDGMPISFGGEDSRIRSGAVAGQPRLVDEFLEFFAGEIAASERKIASGQVR